ncbi:protoporphyrinogen/coproporphyrinogen oxidase [Samsonia erythrinae]|uniref:Protoporphyrinogen oxidase n=1 Tax=Samsonia erythrinae TaxID=160434 RepID=A0A4R3VRY6_9GAMM|nr:NAD(P)/FAD-dependent oxidoreductase [Samsonia erythrinae]TCV08571.1 protoporphyrinogen oxidase [Samsonia erythrinae]
MKKIIVVGGGSSGLTAAYTLKRHGYDVTLFDQDKRPGGRLKMYQKNGFSINIATQLFVPSYKMAHQLAKELDIADQFMTVDMNLMRVYYDNGWVNTNPRSADERARAEAYAQSMGPNLPRLLEWVANISQGIYEGSADWMADLDSDDSGNFADYIRKYFGEEVLENFVQPIVATLAQDNPDKFGIAYGVMLMKSVVGGPCEVLKYGVGDLATQMINYLGDSIVPDSPVKEVKVVNGRATGVVVNDTFYESDAVICATEGSKVIGLIPGLSDAQKQAISKVTYCGCMHSMLFYDTVLSDDMMGGMIPRRTGAPFCGLLLNSRYGNAALPPGKECVSLFYYGAGRDKYWNASQEEIAQVSASEFKKFFPSLPKDYLFAHTEKIPYAIYTMQAGSATAMRKLREQHYQDVKGLYLAGEYLYTGSVESALNSGRRAAEFVMGQRDRM